MMARDGWTWRPSGREIAVSLLWTAVLTPLFIAVYGTTNWITSQRAQLGRYYFDWELQIPFVPQMIWGYLSLFAMFLLPVFALREPGLHTLCRRLALATVASGLLFLALPAQLGFPRPQSVPGYELLFGSIYLLDRPHNLVPSLHIAWSALILHALRGASPGWLRRLLELWFAIVCVSVVLVHQHHVLDVIGGLLVAFSAGALVRPRQRGRHHDAVAGHIDARVHGLRDGACAESGARQEGPR
jgi:membrane-associated phospholipid phosphatase